MKTVIEKVGGTIAMMNNFDGIHFCDYIHKKNVYWGMEYVIGNCY